MKTLENIKSVLKTNQLSFVRGHSYLCENEMNQIAALASLEKEGSEVVDEYETRMTKLIGSGYGISFAAGRMAFHSILKALNIGAGDEVILLGFTCSVMPNAVLRVGAVPVFSDVDANTFGSSAENIASKITSRTKLIVAQHSFGIPCKIKEIAELGKKNGIFVVEDCAITLDSCVDGIKVGNFADAAIFSTDHSKPLNTLIGGFFYTRNESLYKKVRKTSDELPHLDIEHQRRIYKQFLFEREYYVAHRNLRSNFGKVAKSILKKFKINEKGPVFLTADYSAASNNKDYPYPSKMPVFLAQLGLFELERWNDERKERKELLNQYMSVINTYDLRKYIPSAYYDSSLDIVPLRFAFAYPNVSKINNKMSKVLDTNWIWFREPVICCSGEPEKLGYSDGSCPISEKLGKNIINWPCVIAKENRKFVFKCFESVFNC